MSGAPPPAYESAVQGGRPALNVTSPQGETHRANSNEGQHPGKLQRARSNDTVSSFGTDGGYGDGLVDEEGRRSMDDLGRELPKGWVRCFDAKSEHHFYVDESTKRSTWVHPYDDPEYLRTLPDTHPANPNSQQAQAIKKRGEEEEAMARKLKEDKAGAKKSGDWPANTPPIISNGSKPSEDRNWIQRQKDKLVGTKEERAAAKAEKKRVEAERRKQMMEQQEQYLKRRRELIQQHLNNPQSQSSMYAPPSTGYSMSSPMYSSPYGYGYGGGYGRRGYGYGGGMGMGMGMPLMGGLAGGLLIGDMMGGGMGYGGGFGGGCGGGGFGGGGGGGCGGGGM